MIYLIIIFFLALETHMYFQPRAIYNLLEQSFASEKLKTVEIKYQDIDQRVHNIMKSLNSYGIPLEKIHIQQTTQII